MAGYSKLSATANLVDISKKPAEQLPDLQWDTDEFKQYKVNLESINRLTESSDNQVSPKIFNVVHSVPAPYVPESEKKIYIPTYINKLRVVGCVDSGSDLTIMHYSLFERLKIEKSKLLSSEIKQVTSFSDTKGG